MAILDIFKKKQTKKTKPQEKRQEKSVAKQDSLPSAAPKPKRFPEQAYRVLRKPHVTEKAGDLTAKNQYVFEIFPTANKIEVKKSVEALYGVDVDHVRIINIPRKQKIFKGRKGWSPGYKKAIVKIREGQKIEVLPR